MSLILPDPRMEMPELLTPGQKPVGNVEIDWYNSLARELILAPHLSGSLAINLQTGTKLSVGEYVYRVTKDGLVGATASNVSGYVPGFKANQPYTIMMSMEITAWGSGTRPFFASNVAYATSGLYHFRAGVNAFYRFEHWNGTQNVAESAIVPGVRDTICIRWNGSTISLWVWKDDNSLKRASPTSTYTAALAGYGVNNGITSICSSSSGGKEFFRYAYFWNRVLNDHDVMEIKANPYQFLVPA